MWGLIGLIIANQSSLQRKITMQERHLCWPPCSFLGHAVPSQFFILELPLFGARGSVSLLPPTRYAHEGYFLNFRQRASLKNL